MTATKKKRVSLELIGVKYGKLRPGGSMPVLTAGPNYGADGHPPASHAWLIRSTHRPRCDGITARRSRCRKLAAWRVWNGEATHASCLTHLKGRRGWW